MAARSLAGPTSRIEEALNQQCPVFEDTQRDLEGASHEEVVNGVVAEVVMSGPLLTKP
jgi:hypothetical protein